jgi:hypothetical protein
MRVQHLPSPDQPGSQGKFVTAMFTEVKVTLLLKLYKSDKKNNEVEVVSV